MNDFLARLQNGGLLFDGSMGALIEARGVTTNCPALLNAENPALIRAIHQDYRAAGADVSIANTFGANPIKLRALGLENRLDELIEKGVTVGAHHQPEYTAQHGGEQSAQFIVPDAEHHDVASP